MVTHGKKGSIPGETSCYRRLQSAAEEATMRAEGAAPDMLLSEIAAEKRNSLYLHDEFSGQRGSLRTLTFSRSKL